MPQELTTSREAEILDECQKAIGYQFRQPELLRAALTHASGADTRLASNERLEFLGDAVLGLVTCEQLFLRFPDYQEGDLTNFKAAQHPLAQREFGGMRQYHLLDEKGPDHSTCFNIARAIGRHGYTAAWGRNKKAAEQTAAMNALAQINGVPVPFESD